MECIYENVKKIVDIYVDDMFNWQEETIDAILKIVNDGFRYPPRESTEECIIPKDIASNISYKYFNINAYENK